MTEQLNTIALPPTHEIERIVANALAEDLGSLGDLTSLATVPETAQSRACIVARKAGTISGLPIARTAFQQIDPNVSFTTIANDGDTVEAGTKLADIEGSARSILSAERVALNFLGHMSGISTLTHSYTVEVEGNGAKVIDTRKTTPGLRSLEKYAVRCGGGTNHRTGLYDAILIKDNHIAAAGGVRQALSAAQCTANHMTKIEIEVDTLAQLEEVLAIGADAVLLDNMEPKTLKTAVKMVAGRALTEASGGVTLQTVKAIAEAGVDLISIGALTHSAPTLDLGLDFIT